MVSFGEIYDAAVMVRGKDTLESRLQTPLTGQQLAKLTNAYFLSTMSRRIFRAGLRHSMVDKKWPHFEKVFDGFEPGSVRMMSDDDLDRIMQDRGLIRHWGKLRAVRENAQVMHDMQDENAGFGAFLADWRSSNIVSLWRKLRMNFTQLGGNSAPYFLRMVGKDTFLLTNDVLKALGYWGVYEGSGRSIADREYLQGCFNQWAGESDRPLCQLSQIMALSLDC